MNRLGWIHRRKELQSDKWTDGRIDDTWKKTRKMNRRIDDGWKYE